MVVVRIEHLYNITRQILLLHRLLVIALIKGIKLEAFNGLCIPNTQGIYNAVAVADDRQVVRNRLYGLIALLKEMVSAFLIRAHIDITAKFYFLRIFRTAQFKRIAVFQPHIRYFYLIAIPDFLFKHAVTVADSAAICRISKRGKRIQKASSQTS